MLKGGVHKEIKPLLPQQYAQKFSGHLESSG